VSTAPDVVVTDIRMPPTFESEGIEAAQEVRRRHPGTGIVILSQYEEPQFVVELLGKGAAGYAYLLKDRVADGDQLARAVREVAAGGSTLDPRIVESLLNPVQHQDDLTAFERGVLRQIAEGKPIKAIAVAQQTTPEAVSAAIERLFLKLATGAGQGQKSALRDLKALHRAIVDREEQGEQLSRLLPGGLVEKLRETGYEIGRSERLEVTVLMSDVRNYSSIAENADPTVLARQLSEHRAAMNSAILANHGTVMTFVGDAVMAVFGAPLLCENHADRAVAAALAMHAGQASVNQRWAAEGLPIFPMGIGISTGPVAAALLGSPERLEYTVIGDSVNLAQRLQQWADNGEIVMTQATFTALRDPVEAEALPPAEVKGRQAEVLAFRLSSHGAPPEGAQQPTS
jgi:class 3 adenylate cyclase/DNA-binding NarL/FixJ family response regulator